MTAPLATPEPSPAPEPPPASSSSRTESRVDAPRERAGRLLYAGGGLLLTALVGAGLGYWAADREVRWLPTMLGALLVLGVVAVVGMAAGLYLLGPAAGRRRGRRRIVALGALAVIGAAGRLAVEWAAAPSPLTSMSPEAYERSFRLDALAAEAAGDPLVVIEAVSEGVVQSTLEHAAGDYLCAMRPRLPAWVKAQAVARAFGYLGRPYDFDFDFATDQSLVCTEVVWRSYRPQGDAPGLRFDTVTVAGRQTLPANEIARCFQREHGRPDRQLDFVAFIEAERRAVPSDEAAFLLTPDRPKWDVAQR